MSYDITLWFNNLGNSFLSTFLRSFTFIGSDFFYIMLFTLIFWCINKSIGKRVLTITLLTIYINLLLKNLWIRPRPTGMIINRLGDIDDYGFPSTHVMGVTSLWAYLFILSRKYITRFFCFLIIFFTAISRMIHGVNFIEDVVSGILFSLFILFLFKIFEPKITSICNERYTLLQRFLLICFSVGGAIILIILARLENLTGIIAVIGCFFGAMTGIIMEKEYLGFSVDGTLVIRIGRYILGLVLISLVFYGFQVIFDKLNLDNTFFRFILYSLVSFITTYPIPKLFVAMNLSEIKKYSHL